MSADRVQILLSEYRAAFAKGDADPAPFLDQVQGVDRQELDALIDHFLLTAPRRRFDPADYAGSRAEQVVRNVTGRYDLSHDTVVRGWPALLPSLRNRLRMKRSQVVDRLAVALEAKDDRERAEVGDYYHAMEFGTLPAEGVSRTVLESLADIYHVKVSMLREAGEALKGGMASPSVPLFTRQLSDQAFKDPSPGGNGPGDQQVGSLADEDSQPSRIDRLFTGGDE